jgi:hypothetical protein
VLYYRVPKKRGYTLAFFFCFDDPADTYEFAYSYPYTYTDLQRFLCRKDQSCLGGVGSSDSAAAKAIERQPAAAARNLDYRRELLCRTPMHRSHRGGLLSTLSSVCPSRLLPLQKCALQTSR